MLYGLRGFQCPVLEYYGCENDKVPVNPEVVPDQMLQLDPYRSMRPDGFNLTTLKELANHRIIEWIRLEESTVKSSGPTSLLRTVHPSARGTEMCPDGS